MTMIKKIGNTLIILFWLVSFSVCARADTIYLKNGRVIKGIIKEETDNTLELEISIGTVKFRRVEIDSVERSSSMDRRVLKRQWESKKQALEKTRIMREAEVKRKAEQPIKELESARQAGHIVVPVMLNKKVAVSLLVDTGASIIVLSKAVGDRLEVKSDSKDVLIKLRVADGREVEARYVRLENVIVQGVEADGIEAAILLDDNASIVFDGVLGMSFLCKFNFKFDNKNNELILEKIR